jgi:hypothetical protein
MIAKVQTVLDSALLSKKIHSHWMRRSGAADGAADEYVVYTLDGDDALYADDEPIVRNANIAIRYYYRDSYLDTNAGRQKIQERTEAIVAALESNGFAVPYGAFDAGDIDDIGYGTRIIECYYGRVV